MSFFERLKDSPKFARAVGNVMFIGGALVALIGACLSAIWLGFVALAVIMLGFAVQLKYWCCPKCGRLLPMRSMHDIDFCPYCGDELF